MTTITTTKATKVKQVIALLLIYSLFFLEFGTAICNGGSLAIHPEISIIISSILCGCGYLLLMHLAGNKSAKLLAAILAVQSFISHLFDLPEGNNHSTLWIVTNIVVNTLLTVVLLYSYIALINNNRNAISSNLTKWLIAQTVFGVILSGRTFSLFVTKYILNISTDVTSAFGLGLSILLAVTFVVRLITNIKLVRSPLYSAVPFNCEAQTEFSINNRPFIIALLASIAVAALFVLLQTL